MVVSKLTQKSYFQNRSQSMLESFRRLHLFKRPRSRLFKSHLVSRGCVINLIRDESWRFELLLGAHRSGAIVLIGLCPWLKLRCCVGCLRVISSENRRIDRHAKEKDEKKGFSKLIFENQNPTHSSTVTPTISELRFTRFILRHRMSGCTDSSTFWRGGEHSVNSVNSRSNSNICLMLPVG
jgi:hypothetical protein